MNSQALTTHLRTEGRARRRRLLLLSFFATFALYLLAAIFRLQIFEYSSYGDKVLHQITVGSSLAAERGEILDRNGITLAENRTVWRIYISPVDIRKAKKRKGVAFDEIIAKGLSELLGVSYESVYEKTQKSAYLDQTIAKSADEATVKAVLLFARDEGLSSMIHAEAGTERYYPFGSLASHTIGFTGSDNQGLFGLEAYYNAVLSGTDGKYLASVDSQGVKLPNAYTDYVKAESGLTLVTTLDLYLQKELEHQLENARIGADAQNRVTGVVMNVKTGAILAMATSPGFDLNDPYTLDEASAQALASSALSPDSKEYKALRGELLYGMWANKAVSEVYEPGSTFKIVTVSAALESGAVTASANFHCPGYYMVGGCRISCHKRTGHGSLTLAEGLMHSCNPVMMQIAERMGRETFYHYYLAFGYGKKTGIDLPGEGMGLFHSLSSLGSTELATASFGQRFKVSILQQLCAVAVVANGGVPVTPHLLSSLQNEEGETLFTYTMTKKEPAISEKTAKEVAAILEAGVSGNGGAKNAYVEGYRIAAKTGTSEKFEVLDANGNSFLRIGSCVAFAPFDNAEIAVIIVVDEPTSANKYGSAVAAPFVGAYLEKALPYLGFEAEKSAAELTVPSLTGISVKEAKGTLTKLGVSVLVIGEGETVLSQAPNAGTRLFPATAKVILYTESQTEYTAVPKVMGRTLAEALVLLNNAGCNVVITGVSPEGKTAPEAVVVSLSHAEGERVALGTKITVVVRYLNDSA